MYVVCGEWYECVECECECECCVIGMSGVEWGCVVSGISVLSASVCGDELV